MLSRDILQVSWQAESHRVIILWQNESFSQSFGRNKPIGLPVRTSAGAAGLGARAAARDRHLSPPPPPHRRLINGHDIPKSCMHNARNQPKRFTSIPLQIQIRDPLPYFFLLRLFATTQGSQTPLVGVEAYCFNQPQRVTTIKLIWSKLLE